MKAKRKRDEKIEEFIKKRRERAEKSFLHKNLKETLFSKAFFDKLMSLSIYTPKIHRPKSSANQEFFIREEVFDSVYKSVTERRTSLYIIIILCTIFVLEELNNLYHNFNTLGFKNVNRLKKYFYDILSYDTKTNGYLSFVQLIPGIWWLKTTPFLADISSESDLVSIMVYLLKNGRQFSNLSRNYLHDIFFEIFQDDDMAYQAINKNLISSLILSMKLYDIDPRTETFNFEPTLIRKILSTNERVEYFILRGSTEKRNQFTSELENIITAIDKNPLTVSMLLAHLSSFPSFQENVSDYEASIILEACNIMRNIKDEYIKSFSELCISNLTDYGLSDITSVHSMDYEWRHPKLTYLFVLPIYVYFRYRNFASWKGLFSLRKESQNKILIPTVMKTSFFTFILLFLHVNQKYKVKEYMEKLNKFDSIEKYIPKVIKNSFGNEIRFNNILGLNKSQLNVLLASCMSITVDITKLAIIYITPFILLPHGISLGISYQYTKFKRKLISKREYISNKI